MECSKLSDIRLKRFTHNTHALRIAGPPGIEPRNFLEKEVSSRINESFEETLKGYYAFCTVNRGMQPRVAKDYREYATRFLKSSNGVISEETVRQYLTIFLSKKPKTYNNQLEGLRSFVGRFLNRMGHHGQIQTCLATF